MNSIPTGDASKAFRQFAAQRARRADGFQQDVDDQAVTYLLRRLESDRPVPFLIHDALRDARKQCVRAKQRAAVFHATAAESLKYPGMSVAGCSGVAADPADFCVARDLEERIRHRVAGAGPFAMACLECMLAERTIDEIASITGRPSRTVERMRSTIRTMVGSLVAQDAAA